MLKLKVTMPRIITDSFSYRVSFELCGRGTLSYCLLFLMIDSCKIGGHGKRVQINESVRKITFEVTVLRDSGYSATLIKTLENAIYRIYSNKRRGTYLIFRPTSAALIRGRRLFKHCTRQIYFFYIFIQWHTFYLLLFLWTDTKLIVNLELWRTSRGEKT